MPEKRRKTPYAHSGSAKGPLAPSPVKSVKVVKGRRPPPPPSMPKAGAKDGEREFFMTRFNPHSEKWRLVNRMSYAHYMDEETYYKSRIYWWAELPYFEGQRVLWPKKDTDRGMLRSLQDKERKADKQKNFGLSKYGVHIRYGRRGSHDEDATGRVDIWRDPKTGQYHAPQKYIDGQYVRHETLNMEPTNWKPLEEKLHPKLRYTASLEEVTSDENDEYEPHFLGGLYEHDPSIAFSKYGPIRTRPKKVNVVNVASDVPRKFNTRVPKVVRTPSKPKPFVRSRNELPPIPPPPQFKAKPPPNRFLPTKSGKQDPDEYDFIYYNARRACSLPPTRPIPSYIDDTKGHKQLYYESGLAPRYVHKRDYGKIPDYLKERNVEQGRPAEPDFNKFYMAHVCRYFFGHRHCMYCGKRQPINRLGYGHAICGDPEGYSQQAEFEKYYNRKCSDNPAEQREGMMDKEHKKEMKDEGQQGKITKSTGVGTSSRFEASTSTTHVLSTATETNSSPEISKSLAGIDIASTIGFSPTHSWHSSEEDNEHECEEDELEDC